MKIKEVIHLLNETLKIHGDIKVIAVDADTNYQFELKRDNFDFDTNKNCVVIAVGTV